MEVEGAKRGHCPYHLGKHTKGDHDKEVGSDGTECLDKFGRFQLLGLKDWEIMLNGILFYVALDNLVATTSDLVGHSYYGGYVAAIFQETVETGYGEFGRTEKNDLEILHDTKLQNPWHIYKWIRNIYKWLLLPLFNLPLAVLSRWPTLSKRFGTA